VNLAQVEEVHATLLRAGPLTDRYAAGDAAFFGLVEAWIADLERHLGSARLPAAATLAGVRAGLVAVRQGATPRDVQGPRLSGRKLRDAAAADALRRGEAVVREALAPRVRQLQEASEIAGQLAALAMQRGFVGPGDPRLGHEGRLRKVWQALLDDPASSAAAALLQGRVGAFDSLALLDRALGPALP
jgi:hypothetical protein